jgi:hypothetical protein
VHPHSNARASGNVSSRRDPLIDSYAGCELIRGGAKTSAPALNAPGIALQFLVKTATPAPFEHGDTLAPRMSVHGGPSCSI